MEIFTAEAFYELGVKLQLIEEELKREGSIESDPGAKAFLDVNLKVAEADCRRIGLIQSAKLAQRMRSRLDLPDLSHRFNGLRDLIRSEMEEAIFLYLSAGDASYLTQKEPLLGPAARDLFHLAITDSEEASKCLAFGRSTACVFHLMRVTEEGLKTLARLLGIPYAPSWESYLKQISAQLARDWKDKLPAWKVDEEFFRGAAAHLSAVKVAWRNPTMHVVKHYTPEEAKEIYGSVRAFMRHLATKLKES